MGYTFHFCDDFLAPGVSAKVLSYVFIVDNFNFPE